MRPQKAASPEHQTTWAAVVFQHLVPDGKLCCRRQRLRAEERARSGDAAGAAASGASAAADASGASASNDQARAPASAADMHRQEPWRTLTTPLVSFALGGARLLQGSRVAAICSGGRLGRLTIRAHCAAGRRFARLPEGPVALLQVGDLRDAGVAAALRMPPRAAPCDARTGEPAATQAGAGELPGLAGNPGRHLVQPQCCTAHCCTAMLGTARQDIGA